MTYLYIQRTLEAYISRTKGWEGGIYTNLGKECLVQSLNKNVRSSSP